MEDKELNLKEALKGHEEDVFYSPIWGDTVIMKFYEDGFKIVGNSDAQRLKGYLNIGIDGKMDDAGKIMLYPSSEAYLKYPLDAKKAWQEWFDEHKTKRLRAEKGEEYWYLDDELDPVPNQDEQDYIDNSRYAIGNYFLSKELAKQAAETVRNTLLQFHKDNQQ